MQPGDSDGCPACVRPSIRGDHREEGEDEGGHCFIVIHFLVLYGHIASTGDHTPIWPHPLNHRINVDARESCHSARQDIVSSMEGILISRAADSNSAPVVRN